MLVQSSDDTLWNAIFTQSITEIPTTTRLRTELAEIFFFEPEPYIRRMIFLTTGHEEVAGENTEGFDSVLI